ncbi:MAG: hypothetical protein RLY21_2664 [Planctomycetota bacterium]|jgi:uncharacterized protein (TIGR03382 family)
MNASSIRRVGVGLLFGGAIAAASAAQAGITLQTTVVLDGNNVGNQNFLNASVSNTNITDIQPGEGYYGYLSVQTHQTWTGGAFNYTPYGTSISWSPFTSTGFSMTASAGANGNAFAYSMNIWFVVEETGTYRLTTGAGGQLHFWHYGGTAEAPTIAGTTGIDLNSSFSSYDGIFVLERGLHRIDTWGGFGQGNPSASTFLTFQQIPAPGAAALLGAAGLVRSRRRR